ncbi:MAG: tRNA pseudouridine(13) synthase TruD [candidate division WOR-3 bacterium]|nr:tRNA pseudouridine(13) synthase TruD [candidate division WOR-3 bacterium]MCX7837499.1 tRNA pseudouridine(13) synthase TruD [candidate division WOR-3 bacterium]
MKVKVKPEDFIVKEIINLPLKEKGEYAVYLLEKKNFNTLDVIYLLQKKYKFGKIYRLGLKDRYSYSFQYLASKTVRKEIIKEKNFSVSLIGFVERPLKNENLLGNYFQITIRDLKKEEGERIIYNFWETRINGFPNFYGEQRMGSARHKEGFIGYYLIKKDYEKALKLFLATPSPFDESKVKKFKKFLKENWGNWQEARKLAFREYLPVINYLVDNKMDYKGAFKKIPYELLSIFINAYQAYIWNETLNLYLKKLEIPLFPVKYRFGELYFYKDLPLFIKEKLLNLFIPAPSPKIKERNEITEIMEEILKKETLSLKELKIKLKIRGLYFKPYLRKAVVLPTEMQSSELLIDELYKGKYKIILNFFLPAGSYATIFIKRLTI